MTDDVQKEANVLLARTALYSLKDVMFVLKLKRGACRRLIRDGHLRVLRVPGTGNRMRFDPAEVATFIERIKAGKVRPADLTR